jgi:hypothetical protein
MTHTYLETEQHSICVLTDSDGVEHIGIAPKGDDPDLAQLQAYGKALQTAAYSQRLTAMAEGYTGA